MKALLKTLVELRAAWFARAPRERRLLAAAAAVIAIAVLWTLIDWVRSERVRLARALPQAQAQLATMREDAAELQRVARLPARNPPPPAALADTLGTSAQAAGLALELRPDGDGLLLTGLVPFDPLVEWLAAAQRDYGLRVQRFTATREAEGVRVETLLAPVPR